VQPEKLRHNEKQEKRPRADRTAEILQVLPQGDVAQRNQVEDSDMADGKKKSGSGKPPAKGAKETKSAVARGIESSKKQRAAAIQSKPKNAPVQEKRKNALLEYLKGVRVETKKVVWPTRKETVSYTIVVLIACAFFGLFLWGVDSGFLAIIREVFNVSMG
jgi:preprotein translocase subunit SecE